MFYLSFQLTLGNLPRYAEKLNVRHPRGHHGKPLNLSKSISSMSGKSRMSSWMSPNLWPQIPSSVLRNSGRRAPLLSSLSPQLRWRQEPPPQRFQPQKKQGPQQLPGCWHDRLKWTLKNMELYFFQCFVYMYIYIYILGYFFYLFYVVVVSCVA